MNFKDNFNNFCVFPVKYEKPKGTCFFENEQKNTRKRITRSHQYFLLLAGGREGTLKTWIAIRIGLEGEVCTRYWGKCLTSNDSIMPQVILFTFM